MHTQCTHAHTYTCIHRLIGRKSGRGGASINSTVGLLGKGGGGGSHLAKYESGGEGVPLAIRHQTRGIDQPSWLQACIHTCTYTYMHTHTYTRIHTHNAHILTHMHMCVCVCIHVHTHSHIPRNTVGQQIHSERRQLELLKSPV